MQIDIIQGDALEVLKTFPDESIDLIFEVKARYRELAKVYHPDAGGNPKTFEALSRAYHDALQLIGEQ